MNSLDTRIVSAQELRQCHSLPCTVWVPSASRIGLSFGIEHQTLGQILRLCTGPVGLEPDGARNIIAMKLSCTRERAIRTIWNSPNRPPFVK